MKKVYKIAFLLISLTIPFLMANGQTLPAACGGSKVRYGVTGLPGSNYNWVIDGGIINNNYNDSVDVTWNNIQGLHELTVTEYTVTNCVANPVSELVMINIPPNPNLGDTVKVCQGQSTNIGTTVYYNQPSFLWNNDSTSSSISVSVPGWYVLQVTDSGGCVITDSVNLALNPIPDPNLGGPYYVCQGQSINIGTSVSYDKPSFLWNTGSTSGSISVSNQGWYELLVTDSAGCFTMDSAYLTVNALPNIPLSKDTTIPASTSLTLNAGSGNNYYLWNTGQNSQEININNPGTYWVTVTDIAGCVKTDTIIVKEGIATINIRIPNAFTPDNSVENKNWDIVALNNYPNASVEVYDRWGRMVFQAKNGYPSPGWDGTCRGKNLPMDSYFYNIKLNDGTTSSYKGSVTIIR
jgi:gliding motility-associated-like protein